MYDAFLEVRYLGWAGRATQAADLADAFHNLPNGMWRDDFSLVLFRDNYLLRYETKYRPDGPIRTYVKAVDAIIAMTE
jgi:hypothetical protein